ncbi:MAG: redoxin domain-containing protein [Ignavibacteriales bacterium]|nr:redoxin domain-containing protein [Ignavibacteriales bacterium]MBI3786742.1 redoxin domain-containing protein [Ignavibacteriales bacterium]
MKDTVKLNVILILIAVSSFGLFIAMKNYKNDNAEKWIGKPAPELSQGEWINSKPLALSELRGQVVLIEFWAFGCYNCRNTIPHINQWQKQYGDEKFKIIGVHTPEFPKEKIFSKVEDETFKLGIEYAVVTDNNYKTWDAYKQQYWPALYLIDKKGIVRYVHIGEGNYEETEKMIQALLEEK